MRNKWRKRAPNQTRRVMGRRGVHAGWKGTKAPGRIPDRPSERWDSEKSIASLRKILAEVYDEDDA